MHHESALAGGFHIEEYEIVRVLGSGGFGITYLAYDHNLDKPVAIKEYMPSALVVRKLDSSVSPKTERDRQHFEWGLERFLEEARLLARFDHPNIVKVHRVFSAYGTAYLVMEYLEGETLADLMRDEGRLSSKRLLQLIDPLLEGLKLVHDTGFLHRDITPSNIVIRQNGAPVLIDFGSARAALSSKSKALTSIITPHYSPIEQYSSKEAQGPWTDIYSLGAVLYCGLTGTPPPAAADRFRNAELETPVSSTGEELESGLVAAILWALEPRETDRPCTIEEWSALLPYDKHHENASEQRNGPNNRQSTLHHQAPSRNKLSDNKKVVLVVGLTLAVGGLMGVWETRYYHEINTESDAAVSDADVVSDREFRDIRDAMGLRSAAELRERIKSIQMNNGLAPTGVIDEETNLVLWQKGLTVEAVLSRHGDWFVTRYKEKEGDGSICQVVTAAREYFPKGYEGRTNMPPLIVIESLSDPASFYVDLDFSSDPDAREHFYDTGDEPEGYVTLRNGSTVSIPLGFVAEGVIQPIENIDGNSYISSAAMTSLWNGISLVLNGTRKDGSAVQIEYSLEGFRGAFESAKEVCPNSLWDSLLDL